MLLKLFKWICILFIVLVILLACAIFVGNMALPKVATTMMPKLTGYTMEIEDPYVNLWRGEINLKGITLSQEKAFPKPDSVIIQQLAVNIEMRSLFKKQKVLSELIVDVEDVRLARRLAESVGISTLLKTLGSIRPDKIFDSKSGDSSDSSQVAKSDEEKKPSEPMQYLIRSFTLRVDNIRAQVYLPGTDTPITAEAPLMIDKTIHNVTDVQSAVKPIVTDVMKRSLSLMARALTKSVGTTAKDIAGGVGDTGKSLLGSLFGGSSDDEAEKPAETEESTSEEKESGGFLGLF